MDLYRIIHERRIFYIGKTSFTHLMQKYFDIHLLQYLFPLNVFNMVSRKS